ncbi:uncharacterized protein PHACADRAFT_211395 [Phanerochaete carnosa HHB-10118-sp]|uniref:Uncharacterized protein n=1 Tax=Phanerochaete carnosa (strain HHB-10118-sp) TaxID=650164 RepID=K5WTH6_PHACS|nr:uncharacterized protein PHACADRAFT_211395 [Phanerochaete carnosa HHB-10118-sp]EKM53732.1 hypothetical protein PHACADRAFT_211395 [Phanerochaete carnosa HHB-10118-sp]
MRATSSLTVAIQISVVSATERTRKCRDIASRAGWRRSSRRLANGQVREPVLAVEFADVSIDASRVEELKVLVAGLRGSVTTSKRSSADPTPALATVAPGKLQALGCAKESFLEPEVPLHESWGGAGIWDL